MPTRSSAKSSIADAEQIKAVFTNFVQDFQNLQTALFERAEDFGDSVSFSPESYTETVEFAKKYQLLMACTCTNRIGIPPVETTPCHPQARRIILNIYSYCFNAYTKCCNALGIPLKIVN